MKKNMKVLIGAIFCLLLVVVIPGTIPGRINATQPVVSTEMSRAFLYGMISQIETIGGETYAHAIKVQYFGTGGIGTVKDAQISFQSDKFLRYFYMIPQGS